MTLETQYMTLLIMSMNGIVLGAVYDMYRVVLRHWRLLRWAAPIFDFSYWIFAFFLVFWSLLWANNGDLRIYVFVVIGIGIFLYKIFLQKIVVGSTIGIIMGIRYIGLALYRLFVMLVINPLKYLWKVLIQLLRVLDRLLLALEKLILWPLKPAIWIVRGVYRILLRIIKFLLRPLVRLLSPYFAPIWKKLEPIIRYTNTNLKKVLKKGKGIALNLANWLMNRDDHK